MKQKLSYIVRLRFEKKSKMAFQEEKVDFTIQSRWKILMSSNIYACTFAKGDNTAEKNSWRIIFGGKF